MNIGWKVDLSSYFALFKLVVELNFFDVFRLFFDAIRTGLFQVNLSLEGCRQYEKKRRQKNDVFFNSATSINRNASKK